MQSNVMKCFCEVELLIYCHLKCDSRSAEEKLKWAFRLYDLDGSGQVEKAEFENIFETLCK